MKRVCLRDIAAGRVDPVPRRQWFRERFGSEPAPVERWLKQCPPQLRTERVIEQLRFDMIEGSHDVRAHDIGALLESAQMDAMTAVEVLGEEAPVLESAASVGVVPGVLLHYALVELMKNALLRGPLGVELGAASEVAMLMRVKSSGASREEAALLRKGGGWFQTSAPDAMGYAYAGMGGNHGPRPTGRGVGLMMARCALKAFGGNVCMAVSGAEVVATLSIPLDGTREII